MNITLETLIENPAKVRSISKYDLATHYLSESIEKGLFKEYFALLQKAEFGIVQAMLIASNCTVFSVAEFYKNELEFLPPEPKFEYGSQSLIQFFYDILKSYENKTIKLEKYRKQTLFRAVEVLSNDEFKVFKLAITKGFDYRLNDALIELYNSGFFEGNRLKEYFLIGYMTSSLHSVPAELFKRNTTNTEFMYFPKHELKYYLLLGSVYVRLNDKMEKIVDQDDPFIKTNKTFGSNATAINIADGETLIGIINQYHCYIFRLEGDCLEVTEHAFSIKLCEGLRNALVLNGQEIVGAINFENGTLKETVKKASEFSVSVIPYYGYSASVINCKDKEEDKSFFIFAKTEDANKIGKTRQNFKVIELLNQYYLIG